MITRYELLSTRQLVNANGIVEVKYDWEQLKDADSMFNSKMGYESRGELIVFFLI